MTLLKRSLPLWIVLIAFFSQSIGAADAAPPPKPPGGGGWQKQPGKPPGGGGWQKQPGKPPGGGGWQKQPGKPPGGGGWQKQPGKPPGGGGWQKQPGKPPGGGGWQKQPGKPPGGPPKQASKNWWDPMTKPGFWLNQYGHRSRPHRDSRWYLDSHPYRVPVGVEVDPDWRPEEPVVGPLELLNENDVTLQCRINGRLVTFPPGHVLPLEAGRLWTIEFHRGGRFGVARRELVEGIYKFVRTDRGWKLMRVEDTPAPEEPEPHIPANPW